MTGLRKPAIVCAFGLLMAAMLLLIVPALATSGDLGINSGADTDDRPEEIVYTMPPPPASLTPNATFQAQQQAKQGTGTPVATNTSVPAATATATPTA